MKQSKKNIGIVSIVILIVVIIFGLYGCVAKFKFIQNPNFATQPLK